MDSGGVPDGSSSNSTTDIENISIQMPATILTFTIPSFAIFITFVKVLLFILSGLVRRWKTRTKCQFTNGSHTCGCNCQTVICCRVMGNLSTIFWVLIFTAPEWLIFLGR